MLTKGAIGNLINRYTAVLKKCHLLNTFGSLAVASMLVLGGAGVAEAARFLSDTAWNNASQLTIDADYLAEKGVTSITGYSYTQNGGAISVPANKTLTIKGEEGKHIIFENNTSTGHGGALSATTGATIDATYATFSGNYSSYTEKNKLGQISTNGKTGAIYFNGGHGIFTHAKFEKNYADGTKGPGAIYVDNGTLKLTDVEFTENYTDDNGGALVAKNSTVNIYGSTFTNNYSGNKGGAIYVDTGCEVNFYNTNTFSKNFLNTNTKKIDNDIYNYSGSTVNVKAGATLSLGSGYLGNGTLVFEQGSTLLVEDASKFIDNETSSPLLNGSPRSHNPTIGGTLTVHPGAKLKLNGVSAGETYRIADNFKSGSKYWTSNDIILTSLLLEGEAKVDAGDKGLIVDVSGTADGDIAAALPGVIPVNALNEITNSGIDTGSDFMGLRFLSRATDTDYLPVKAAEPAKADDTTPATPPANRAATYSLRSTRATPGTTASTPATTASTAATAIGADLTATAVKLINEVARAAVTVGVQNTALRISDAAADLSLDHLSLANHDKASAFHSGGSDFWAAPLYGNLYSSGMTLNSDSVRGQFGGLALGADTEIGQIAGGKMRLGAALHGGGGQSETKGTLTTAQNDYDFGGLSFYAGWNKGAFNLIGSLGYGFGNHEVEMALPSSIDMGVAKADIDTTAFTADLRAEYELKAGWLNVVPHIGLRYTMLKTDAHELSVPGGVMTEFAADTQNIVQFPIGVALSADTTFGGWTVKPGADFSFIPACGETDAYTRMHFTGVDAWDSVNSRIMDSTSYAAELSLKAEKGNFSLGLSYGVQASSHETDQNIQFKLGWKF